EQTPLLRPELRYDLLPRGELVEREAELPESRANFDRQHIVAPVRTRDPGENLANLEQHQLVLAHVYPENAFRARATGPAPGAYRRRRGLRVRDRRVSARPRPGSGSAPCPAARPGTRTRPRIRPGRASPRPSGRPAPR